MPVLGSLTCSRLWIPTDVALRLHLTHGPLGFSILEPLHRLLVQSDPPVSRQRLLHHAHPSAYLTVCILHPVGYKASPVTNACLMVVS